jgi:hypothetical protein
MKETKKIADEFEKADVRNQKIELGENFRIKLEASLRMLERCLIHLCSNVIEDEQSIKNNLCAGMLEVLYETRDDVNIDYNNNLNNYSLLSTVICNEFNTMNERLSILYRQELPHLLKNIKTDSEVANTCDRIVDILKAEFALLK